MSDYLNDFKSSFQKINFKINPYPYFSINNVFEERNYQKLRESFPSNNFFGSLNDLEQNNKAILMHRNSYQNKINDKTWEPILDYLVSNEFFKKVTNIYSEGISKFFPNLANLQKLRVGVEGKDTFKNKDILLDAHFGINTPTKSETSVRPAHFDNPKILYAGLLYVKDDDDNTIGGNFGVFKTKNKNVYVDNGRLISDEQVDLVNQIDYVGNNLVCFLNSNKSVHGVTPKKPSSFTRRYINFNACFSHNLFSLNPNTKLNKLKKFFFN